jgi:hypothetical protein
LTISWLQRWVRSILPRAGCAAHRFRAVAPSARAGVAEDGGPDRDWRAAVDGEPVLHVSCVPPRTWEARRDSRSDSRSIPSKAFGLVAGRVLTRRGALRVWRDGGLVSRGRVAWAGERSGGQPAREKERQSLRWRRELSQPKGAEGRPRVKARDHRSPFDEAVVAKNHGTRCTPPRWREPSVCGESRRTAVMGACDEHASGAQRPNTP